MSGEAPLELKANAKVNLTLEVLGKRSDGYHQVRTVMQTITLADSLTFSLHSELLVEGSVAGIQPERELVRRAADELRRATGCQLGARIGVEKKIPIGMGLGGGSSDAAATLIGLNRLWGLGLPLEALWSIGQRLGSDVPFFVQGGTALAEGRGEVVTPLPPIPSRWLLVACPPISLPGKTAKLYSLLREVHYTNGSYTERLLQALRNSSDYEPLLYNVFEHVAPEAYLQLPHYRELMLSAGIKRVGLTGAGPGLFALVEDRRQGEELLARLKHQGVRAYLAATV